MTSRGAAAASAAVLLSVCAADVAGAAPVQCPSPYESFGNYCILRVSEPLSWFDAEGVCRKHGGHLLSITESAYKSVLFQGESDVWTSGHHGNDGWAWTNGQSFNHGSLDLILQGSSLPTSPTIEKSCLSVEPQSLKKKPADCREGLSFVCAYGGRGCAWADHELKFHAVAPRPPPQNEPHHMSLMNGVLTMQGHAFGIGTWPAPDTYRIEKDGTNQVACTWLARFSEDSDGKYHVDVGCEDPARAGSFVSSIRHEITKELSCRKDGVTLDTRAPSNEWGKATKPPGHVPDRNNEEDKPTSVPGVTMAKTDTSDSVPLWVWPIAFVAVAVVSALAAVGAVKRRDRKGSATSSEDEAAVSPHSSDPENPVTLGEGGGEDEDGAPQPLRCPRHKKTTATCETCKKFNNDVAKKRLKAVHEQLQRGFALPLVVHDTRCEHIGSDHVHIFTVENDFDASSLGALSTVYSRTKPRLPRNTRVHIVHNRSQDGEDKMNETDFAGDMAYYGATYY